MGIYVPHSLGMLIVALLQCCCGMPGESKKYTHSMSYKKVTIASIL